MFVSVTWKENPLLPALQPPPPSVEGAAVGSFRHLGSWLAGWGGGDFYDSLPSSPTTGLVLLLPWREVLALLQCTVERWRW